MFKIWFVRIIIFIGCAGLSLSRGDGGQQNWPQQDWNMKGGQAKGPLGGWDDEPSNPWGGGKGGYKLEDSIPGIPGQSYPNFDKIPETSFDCRRQKNPGYYGDVESQCQVFHICQAGGRQNSFLCPIGTIFNQESFVCDWWFNVNCGDAPFHYDRNENLFRGSDIGIDGSKIKKKGPQGNSKGSDQPSAVGIPAWNTQVGDDNWGMKGAMKGAMNQGGQQGPWSNTGGSNKPKGRPNANVGGRGGQNKGSDRSNVGGNWQNTGNQGGQNKGSGRGNVGGNWQNSRNQGGQNKGSGRGNVGGNLQNIGNQGGQNKGSSRGNVGGGNRQNSGSQGGQKGFGMAGNMNPEWGNQGNIPGRNKGINKQLTQGRGGQKGDMLGGNNKMQRRSGLPPNGGASGQGQKGQAGGGNFGMGNQRTKGSAGRGGSFSANSWSMGTQNYQFSFNEKGNNFPNNPNSRDGPSSLPDNNSWQGPVNFQPDGHFKEEDGNSNWNSAGGDFNQWGNRISNFQPELGNNIVGGQDNWKPDYDEGNGDSFHLNDKGAFEGQAGENDYDYVWNS